MVFYLYQYKIGKMKTVTYIILALGFSLFGCNSQKKLVENPPFKTGEATCQQWAGGRAESGSGILLQIPLTNDNIGQRKLQQAYFRGKVADIKMKSNDGVWFAEANFRQSNTKKPDIVMHSDAKKEVGNQPPTMNKELPFELGENECVISYDEEGKTKYFKISDIKEKKPLIYQ